MTRLHAESGVALPTALFAIVMITILVAGIWVSVDVSARSTQNREESLKAIQIAEAGAHHALAVLNEELADTTYTRLLQGDDGLPLTDDDGYLVGFGLDSGVEIPADGIAFADGTYTVRIVNDPADPTTDVLDTNDRIMLRCTGTTNRGGIAVVEAVLGENVSDPDDPIVVVDGDLMISGNPRLLGSCGLVHANDDLTVSGDVVVEQYVSASDQVTVNGSAELPDGEDAPRKEDQPTIAVEDINNPLATHCDDADYILQSNGYIERTSDGSLHDARSDAKFGWKRAGTGPTMWDYDSDDGYPGTFCVHGNAKMGKNPGEGEASPVSMSIIASGSIEVSGNPYLTADSETGYLFIAAGDLKLNGNMTGGSGKMYARHQCDISGNPVLSTQISCKNRTGGSGVKNLVNQNKISGAPRLDWDCAAGGASGDGPKRSVVSWSQRFGA